MQRPPIPADDLPPAPAGCAGRVNVPVKVMTEKPVAKGNRTSAQRQVGRPL